MIRILPYQEVHKASVIALVISIQRDEFGIAITAEEQPDLMDIPGFCQKGRGNFWVALDARESERNPGAVQNNHSGGHDVLSVEPFLHGRKEEVIGTIALVDIGEGMGALRKMFVQRDYRGWEKGVARDLLATLLAWARAQGLGEILLGTIADYHAAHRFYEKHGFSEISAEALPANFPRFRLDTRFYRMVL